MRLNKSIIFVFTLLFVLLISITVISAASNSSDIQQTSLSTTSNSTQSTLTDTNNIVSTTSSNDNSNTNNIIETTTQKQSQQSDQKSITPTQTVTKKATNTQKDTINTNITKNNQKTSTNIINNDNQDVKVTTPTTTVNINTLKTVKRATKTVTTWSELNTAVNTAQDGDIIILQKDTTFTATGTLKISHNLNITGENQNVIIDGQNKYQIMNITTGYSLNITNITFINGNSTTGGAIYNNGNVTIMHSIFTLNNATSGGAIYNEIGNMTLKNDTFTYNNASYGGAICNNATVDGINEETQEYFIIKYNTNVTLINNTLSNNIVTDIGDESSKGGAIYNNGNITLTNNTITYNNASSGGAIYNNMGNITFINNTINKNQAPWGGAVYSESINYPEGNEAVYETNLIFINNTLSYNNATEKYRSSNGGAIYNNGNMTLINNTITYNRASTAGAIYNYGSAYEGEIIIPYNMTVTLINNFICYNNAITTGTTGCPSAGAIFNSDGGNITLINNTISNNTVNYYDGSTTYYWPGGGAIYSIGYCVYMNITNNTISNNTVNGTNVQGGAIYNGYLSSMNLTNNTFYNNLANATNQAEGGAIYESVVWENRYIGDVEKPDSAVMLINNTMFNNTATAASGTSNGGAIYTGGDMVLINNIISHNNASYGGAIYSYPVSYDNNGAVTLYNINVTFTNNTISYNNATYGGAVYTAYTNTTFTGNQLINNTVTESGSEIYNTQYNNLTANYNIFLNSTDSNGIEIYNNGTGIIKSLDYNWWGHNDTNYVNSPDSNGLKLTNYQGENLTKWLYLNITSDNNKWIVNTPVTITVDLTRYSAGTTTGTIDGSLLPQDIPVTFTSTTGQITPINTKFVNGVATTSYTPKSTDESTITANVYTNSTSLTNTAIVVIIDTIVKVTPTVGTSTTNSEFKINVTDFKGNEIKLGNVTIKNGDIVLGTIDLSNTNIFSTLLTPAGTYTLTFVYNDTTGTYKNNTNTTTVSISTTSTTIVMGNVNGTTNQNITITAIVTSNGNLLSTGSVTFTDTNGLSKTVDVTNGIATVVTSYASRGNYTIIAVYNGNDVYSSSQTTANAIIKVNDVVMNVTVNPATTTTNTTFNVTLKDIGGNIVDDGTVYFYNNGTLIGNAIVTNGVATFNNVFNKAGSYNITAIYNSTTYNSVNKTVNFTVEKSNTNLVVNPITGVVQNTINLQANITDQYGNNVTSGKVVFKINGTTIKDTYGNVLYANVTNGVAKLEYIIPSSLVKNNLTIEAKYSGTTDTYNPSNNTNTINVTKRTADLTVTVTKNPVKATDNVTFMALVHDSNGTILNNGVVVFKFQGKTIRDAEGNPILVNVTNGIAKLQYIIPNGISAREYNITAVYANNNYTRVEAIAPITAQKVQSTITLNQITTTRGSNTALLTGTIKDSNGNLMTGTHKISVKLNGKNIGTYTVTNGAINTNITIPNTLKNTNYQINVKIGESNGYYSTNTTTTLTINNLKTLKEKVSI